MKPKSNFKQKSYIFGEILGKGSIWCARATIILYVLGAACELAWDIAERREYKKKFNSKKH